MNSFVRALAASLCFVSASAVAEEPLETIPVDREAPPALSREEAVPYTYAGLGFFKTDYKENDVSQDGFALEGSYMILPNVFITGMYYAGETDEVPGLGAIEVTQMNLGAGYRHMLSMTISLFATIELVEADLEADSGDSDSDSGYELDVGLRGMLADRIEGKGELQYLDIGQDGELYLNLQALYTVVPRVQVGLDLLNGDNQTSYGLLGRYSF